MLLLSQSIPIIPCHISRQVIVPSAVLKGVKWRLPLEVEIRIGKAWLGLSYELKFKFEREHISPEGNALLETGKVVLDRMVMGLYF